MNRATLLPVLVRFEVRRGGVVPSIETSLLSPVDTGASYMLASAITPLLAMTLLFFRDDFREESLDPFDRGIGRAGVEVLFLMGRAGVADAFFALAFFSTSRPSSDIGGGDERGESPSKDIISSTLRFVAVDFKALGRGGGASNEVSELGGGCP